MKKASLVVLVAVLLTAATSAFFRVRTPTSPLGPDEISVVALVWVIVCTGVAALLKKKKKEEPRAEGGTK
jgi:TRAP-type C4-dicarboxylate transport system permease small subunit